jgi:hypothetical protein
VPKIPAFQVRITDTATNQVVVDKKITDGPSNDDRSLVEHRYGADWERVRIRQKTDEGNMHVVFRWLNGGSYVTEEKEAKPSVPVEVQKPNGARFRVDILSVPEAEWKTAEALEFKAPKVKITGDGNGWHIEFTPQQKPAVYTVAIGDAAKPETLPSVPFPSSFPQATATLYLRKGEFGAVDDAILRLGVRGAGMGVRVKLPAGNGVVEVQPENFDRSGTPNPAQLQDAYVQQKYNENAGLIQQRVVYK